MSEGIIAINPLMPYEDIRAGKITTPALGLGLGAFGMGAYQSMKDDDTNLSSLRSKSRQLCNIFIPLSEINLDIPNSFEELKEIDGFYDE